MREIALITGAAKRIGAVIATVLHQAGMNVVIHYHHSKEDADQLCQQLNTLRPMSAVTTQGDISKVSDCRKIMDESIHAFGQLNVLVNNASSFYPTKMQNANEEEWENLLGSNLKGPFFLSQAAEPYLQNTQGNIINIVDIHADRPLKNYPIYSIAKAGLVMLTKALAREFAPNIRVNAVAPGVIMWPNQENDLPEPIQTHIINRTCLKRRGDPLDIAETVLFLIKQNYITGQVIAVDGGRSIKD